MATIDPKLKTRAIVLGAVVFALAAVDFVVLKGETVASGNVSLRSGAAALRIPISRPGEEHLVEISTRRHRNNESRGLSIAYQLIAPDGSIAAEDSEILSHKKRFFEFVPTQSGDYQLHAKETKLLGSGRGTGFVRVTVGDRRVLSRLLAF